MQGPEKLRLEPNRGIPEVRECFRSENKIRGRVYVWIEPVLCLQKRQAKQGNAARAATATPKTGLDAMFQHLEQ
jgi:hypothetical protein